MRTKVIVISIFACFLFQTCSKKSNSNTVSDNRPNIVFLMADDVSAKEFSCYGNSMISTPFLDHLANEGALFNNCWATPVCSPTRALVMTGKYGFRTGWFHNELKPANEPLAEKYPIFSQLLKEAGYKTAICGKWQLPGTYEQHGFDEYCIWTTSKRGDASSFDGPVEGEELRGKPGTYIGRTARYWHPCIDRNGTILNTDADDYGPDIFVEFLLDFVKRNKDKPFLAYYPMCLPHKSWDFDLERSGYLPVPGVDGDGNLIEGRVEGSLKSNVEYIDVLVKRIVEGLKNENVWDNTIFVFTGDNGTTGYGKGNVNEERGPKVPMIFSSGKQIKELGKIDALMDFSDLLPTFCDIAGTNLPEDEIFDGFSVLPILKGETNDVREWMFSYYSDYRMLRDKRWLLDGNDKFYDCANTQGNYIDVTNSTDDEVLEAQKRFEQILRNLPGPTKGQVESFSFINQGRTPPLKYEY